LAKVKGIATSKTNVGDYDLFRRPPSVFLQCLKKNFIFFTCTATGVQNAPAEHFMHTNPPLLRLDGREEEK